jgi:hypothetical protein
MNLVCHVPVSLAFGADDLAIFDHRHAVPQTLNSCMAFAMKPSAVIEGKQQKTKPVMTCARGEA